jgi:hypothetical protein
MPVEGSFIFEFFLHLPADKMEYWIREIETDGGRIEEVSPRCFRVACDTPKQLNKVGRAIFQTSLKNYGRVIGVEGDAYLEAAAYPWLHTRVERKGN